MDEDKLLEKIERMKQDGPDSLFIVSDFDGTLTKKFRDDGTAAPNSVNVFRKERYLSEEYIKRTTNLADKYLPIENNPNIPASERSGAMVEWWTGHFDAMIKYGLTKSIIENAGKSGKIIMREDIEIFFDFLRKQKVPLVVLSAGLGDVIRILLLKHNAFPDEVEVLSNFSRFDDEGKFVGVRHEVMHSLNKNLYSLKDIPFYKKVDGRKNAILIGDSLGDLSMLEGLDCETVLKIGFFHEKGNKELERAFLEEFDIVFEDDVSMDAIIGLLIRILGEG